MRLIPKRKLSLPPIATLLLTAMALLIFGCGRNDNSTPQLYQEFGKDIADSLSAGRITGARRLVDRELADAGNDSDAYFTALCKRGIVDYYMSNADGILAADDSVIAWMTRRPESPSRNFVIGKAYSTKAGYYTRFVYNPDSNIYYYKKALDYFSRTSQPEVYSDALFNLGGAYKNNGRPDKGAAMFGRAIQVADSAGLPDSYRIPLYSGLASAYTSLMDFERSDLWWDKTGRYWDHMTVDDRFHYLNNRGNDLYMQKRYPESLSYFLRLDSLLAHNPDLEWERNFCRANLNDVYLRLGMPDSVREALESTEKYFTEVQPNPYILEHIRTQHMQLAVLEKRYAEVERMFSQWEADGLETRPEQIVERLEFLRDYYAGTGQWRKAFEAMKRHNESDDSIRSHALRLSASEQQMRYERDSRVLALGKDLELHKKLRDRDRILVAAAVILIILLVIIIVMMRRFSGAREERMLNRIIRLRIDAMRARVNPHFIYNVLNHEIAAREKGEDSCMGSLVELLRRQQYMADELSVTMAEDLAFIDDFVRVESRIFKAPLIYEKQIDADIDTSTVRVPSMIMQIFVENAFKHGFTTLPDDSARLLRIVVTRDGDRMVARVYNNAGKASDGGGESTHLGLRIVSETLQILNEHNRRHMKFDLAEWTDNPQGHGCCATLEVPLDFNFDITR